MLGMSNLKILVKKAFDRGFIDSHVLGFEHFEQDLRRGIEHPGVQMIMNIRFSVTPSKSCPDGYCFTADAERMA
jgi:hypothetical protein